MRRRRDAGPKAAERRRRDVQEIEENVDEKQTGPEAGHRHPDDSDHAPDMVDEGVAVDGRQYTKRNADHDREQQGGKIQFQRRGQTLDEVLGYRSPGRRTLAEVAMEKTGDVAEILLRHRTVQPHLVFHFGQMLRRRERARFHHGRIARQHISQEETDQAHTEQGRQHKR